MSKSVMMKTDNNITADNNIKSLNEHIDTRVSIIIETEKSMTGTPHRLETDIMLSIRMREAGRNRFIGTTVRKVLWATAVAASLTLGILAGNIAATTSTGGNDNEELALLNDIEIENIEVFLSN